MTNRSTALAALAEPMRTEIIERLAERPMPVNELAATLPISRPAVSQHLKVLKAAALVRDQSDGTRRIYSIDPAGLGQIRQWLDRHWDRALAAYQHAVEKEEEQ
jgi:DNA-binding transcriptional ArsR family regulator